MVHSHSLAITPATTATHISSTSRKTAAIRCPSLGFNGAWGCSRGIGDSKPTTVSWDVKLVVDRRSMTMAVAGAVLSWHIGGQSANAAARRPPSSPPEEKKDPSISGVQAKVLASKKRKEAMKQSMAELREKGKTIEEAKPSSAVVEAPTSPQEKK